MGGVQGFGAVAGYGPVRLVPLVSPLLVLIVEIEKDLSGEFGGKSPGLLDLRHPVDDAAVNIESLHEAFEFLPFLVNPEVDDLPGPGGLGSPDDHMEVLPLVNPHGAGPRVGFGHAVRPAEGINRLQGNPVGRLHPGHSDPEIVKVRQVLGSPKVAQQLLHIHEMAHELRVVVASHILYFRPLGCPLADRRIEFGSCTSRSPG